ncbi:translation elongation factor EF1A/initiation factor IF2gamma family protein isoform X2 [Wolffia australiana]
MKKIMKCMTSMMTIIMIRKRPHQPAKSHNKKKANIWRCPICTYDNDESLSYCDICGVIRDASLTVNDKEKENGSLRKAEVSMLAKSLFSSSPPVSGKLKSEPSTLNGNNIQVIKETKSHPGDLTKVVLASGGASHGDTAPFKFDSPSPDDIVFAGKNASKVNPRARAQSSAAKDANSAENLETSARLTLKDPQSEVGGSGQRAEEGSTSLSSKLSGLGLGQTLEGAHKREYKPEEWMLSDKEGALTQLNLAIVGHVDSGKSTISGRLLHQLGRISRKEMHKYEKESREKGKASFAYAWALDESSEERERGVTMTVGVAHVDSGRHHMVLLDSPGHRDLVPNLIMGAAQADVAVLVIDGAPGAFEAGMEGGGQTREHAQLVRSFGVDQMVVVVNKMDLVGYAQERFCTIKAHLAQFLRSCGFKEASITWVPLSSMENQNLIEPPSDPRICSWYKGPSLLEAIDALQPPLRDIAKPLRMPICDVIKSRGQGQVSASGKLEAGAMRDGTKVLVMPSGELATVRSMERDSRPCHVARAGDNVAVVLQGIDMSAVMSGGVLCHIDFPVQVAAALELKILMLDVATPILVGAEVEFHIHHAREVARVTKIVSVVDPKTGKAAKKVARFLSSKQSAVIEVALTGAVCVEEFSKCRALGRVFLRSSGNTIAVGIVIKVLEL